jgi:cysteine desulfuration protein SufE
MEPAELIARFESLYDWEERYSYLIQMGRKLPVFPEESRTEANKVIGCISQVWVVSDFVDGRIQLQADSDAFIVKGLIAMLVALLNNKTSEEVLLVDIESIFSEIGLDEHLSPNRRNGFVAMVQRIRNMAQATT